VIKQTYQDWECIIINDGSPDHTSDIAHQLIANYPDKSIRLIEKPNGGVVEARNVGIKASQGVYFLPLDADDKIAPTFLEKAVRILEEHPDIGFVYSHVQHFGIKHSVGYLPDFDADTIVHTKNIACVCSLIRKSLWEEVGGYDPIMKEGYEDWDFWIGCIEKGWKGYRIPEALFWYRKKEDSRNEDANRKRDQLIARIVLKHPQLYSEHRRHQAERTIVSNEALASPFAEATEVNLIIDFNDLKVGLRVKIKGKLNESGAFVAQKISVKEPEEESAIEGLIRNIDFQRNILYLLNGEVALPEGIEIKGLQHDTISAKDLKTGDRVKLKGKHSPRTGFVADKIKLQETTEYKMEELQGDIDKIDREKKTLEVIGFTVAVDEKTIFL
jgi:glycosyltransferase involved in cell wall biosynthesis